MGYPFLGSLQNSPDILDSSTGPLVVCLVVGTHNEGGKHGYRYHRVEDGRQYCTQNIDYHAPVKTNTST